MFREFDPFFVGHVIKQLFFFLEVFAIARSETLDLRLDLQTQLYRLEGRVRWSREDESFNVGLLINDQSQDFSAWTEMFELDF